MAPLFCFGEISAGRIDPDQAWFWTPEWQAKEREADANLAAGRVTPYEADGELLVTLDERTKPLDADA
jgi:antitoxin PrlF